MHLCEACGSTRRRDPGSEELLTSRKLLRHHTGDGDHRQSAVIELLGLHLRELRRRVWLEAERIEAVVAGSVLLADGPALHVRVLEGEDRVNLQHGDGEDHCRPEGLQRRLLEGDVRRRIDAAAEKRMELLGDWEAERSEHRDSAVLELDLAVEAHLTLGGLALGAAAGCAEARRVEEAQRPADAGQGLGEGLCEKMGELCQSFLSRIACDLDRKGRHKQMVCACVLAVLTLASKPMVDGS